MKHALKWIGIALGSIVALALVGVGALYAISGSKLKAKKDVVAETELTIPTDSASLARGEHLVRSLPCGECHGADMGGSILADAGPFALIAAPNLTSGRGGRPTPRSDVEWERAIRHGVRQDSTSLIIMPSDVFHNIADADMAPMIAYLKRLPPVDREIPQFKLRILGRVLLGLGQVPLVADTTARTAHITSVDTTMGAAYGQYLATISGCAACHGASLSGVNGSGPDDPAAANITPTGIGHYTEVDFFRAMREGKRPAGTDINEMMPWKSFTHMSESELRSIFMYLQTVPPKQFAEK
ncbi:MAG: c-type cytochrome [Gemmatimonadota bacterium]